MNKALKELKSYLDIVLPFYANNEFSPYKTILEVSIEFGRQLHTALQEIEDRENTNHYD